MRALGRPFNTLAQSGTTQIDKPTQIIRGEGTDLANVSRMDGKAKRKAITNAMALSLIDVAKNKGDTERLPSYWNTFYCQTKLTTTAGRSYGNYCKNRHCTICCANRKADIINRYLPVILKWEDPHFVTLTSKAVSARNLKRNIDATLRAFNRIKERFKKRYQRGKIEFKFQGVRSLECNFNAKKRTYNPHLHIIVANKEMAEALIEEWLSIWTPKYTFHAAQNFSRIEDPERCLVEVVKYGSKIFTEPDVNNKSKSKGDRDIYAAALHNIFRAMKGRRIFDRFGFNLPKERIREYKSKEVRNFVNWKYNNRLGNWERDEGDEVLTTYKMPFMLEFLLENHIDKSLE